MSLLFRVELSRAVPVVGCGSHPARTGPPVDRSPGQWPGSGWPTSPRSAAPPA